MTGTASRSRAPASNADRAAAQREPPGRTPGIRRKIVAIDEETWQGLDLLRRDTFATFQELAEEAFADLLAKHHRPVTLREALKQSAKAAAAATVRRGAKGQ